MSQTSPKVSKMHKLKIRNKKEADGRISAGANMEVLLDDQLLGGVSFLKFEVKARKVAKVTIEMYADVELDANLPLVIYDVKELPTSNKPKALYAISSYFPKAIVDGEEK